MERPAKKRALAKLEKAIGAQLNPELRALWEQCDGSNGAPFLQDGKYLFSYEFLSVAASPR
ncbi:MAG: SMI1/KNR4 family protein [Myxococcales bacterium]|nr:SMI1/KNR4 family protein [Myxococcales bacterium]